MNNRDNQLNLIKNVIKEELEAVLGGGTNEPPKIEAPIYNNNGISINISNVKNLNNLKIISKDIEYIQISSPIFSNSSDNIRLTYFYELTYVNMDDNRGTPINLANQIKEYIKIEAKFDAATNSIILNVIFNDGFSKIKRDIKSNNNSVINNGKHYYDTVEKIDIILPKNLEGLFRKGKFKIDKSMA